MLRATSRVTGLSYLTNTGPDSRAARIKELYLFVHGWACSASDFESLLVSLSKATVERQPGSLYVAPDLPSHGKSPQSICPVPSVLAYGQLLNNLIDEFVHDQDHDVRVILVGHSMGCRIVYEMFQQRQTNVVAIILTDGSWYGPDPKDYRPVGQTREEQLQIVENVLKTMWRPLTPESFKSQVVQHARNLDLDYEQILSKSYVSWDGESMEDVMRMVKTGKTRVLLVQGTEGKGAGRHSLKTGQPLGPWMSYVDDRLGSQHDGVIMEDTGHWPHVDKADEVAQAIDTFVKHLP